MTSPDGTISTSTTKHWSRRLTQVGNYKVSLAVSDGIHSSAVSHTLAVKPLTIAADVEHTELWYAYHREAGHETEEHPKDFYSGEKMVLIAVTSPAPVDSLVATLQTIGADDTPLHVAVSLDEAAEQI